MTRLPAFLAAVALLGSNAIAQEYVVDLECLVFDRNLTDAENELIRLVIKDLPRNAQGSAYAAEHLRLLRQNTNQLLAINSTMVLQKTGTETQKLKTDRMHMEAHIRFVEANEESCKLDIQWGVAFRWNDRQSSWGTHTEQRWVPLNTEQQLSASGGDNHYRLFIIHVRKATEDDRSPKSLPADFGRELRPILGKGETEGNRVQ